MTISQLHEIDGQTVSTAEYSIPNGGTTLQTLTTDAFAQLWVDANTMAKGDDFKARIYEKVLSSGTKRVIATFPMSQAVESGSGNYMSPGFALMHGWDMTLQRVTGADRAMDASIRSLTATVSEVETVAASTIANTEYSLVTDSTTPGAIATPGAYQLFLDCTNMVKNDIYRIKFKEVVEATGNTQRTFASWFVMGLQAEVFVSPVVTTMFGFDVTVQRISATSRAFDASIRKIG